MDKIIIKGARANNLKNIDIEIPKNKLVVVTGVSGSGKSSLAFDTIYAEGQRRYVESLSAYARQFLGNTERVDVDSIEGLSPSISIDQKTTNNNPRSTVGTVTEIYDYLRLLFSRIGIPYCPTHNIPITSQSIEEMTNKVLELPEGSKIMILSPLVKGEKGTHKDLLEILRKDGYIRVKINGEIHDLTEDIELDKNTIDVNSNIRKEELEDSLKNISLHNNNNNNYFGYIDKLAIQLDDKFTKNRPCQIIHFKFDSEKLKMVAKKYNTTVTSYLLSLMFVASKFCVTNNKGYLTITIPVNVRKFFSSETLRNFSLFCKIDFKIDDISDVSSIVDNVTFKLKQKSNIDSMNYMINSTNFVVKFWNFVPLIMKRTGAKNVYNFSSSYISSNILSNLGEIHLEDSISKYVEGFDCSMNNTMKSPFTCSVVTVKNVTTFTITKFVKNKKFEEKMYELFCDDEFRVTVPRDALRTIVFGVAVAPSLVSNTAARDTVRETVERAVFFCVWVVIDVVSESLFVVGITREAVAPNADGAQITNAKKHVANFLISWVNYIIFEY